MNPNSLDNQLGWCITTKDYLNDLNLELSSMKDRYNGMITFLRSSGYMRELLPSIEAMGADFEQEINELIKYIQDEHLAYIQIQADATASIIDTLLNQPKAVHTQAVVSNRVDQLLNRP